MGTMVIRSSLEMMLDAIRQRDEQPKDLLPALPVRPMSRGRLPTSRRPCVAHLKLAGSQTGNLPNFVKLQGKREEQNWRVVLRTDTFGSEMISTVTELEESRCIGFPGHVSCEVADVTKLLTVPSPTALVTDNTLDYSGKVLHGHDKVTNLEDARNMNLQAILCVQKNYRALRAQVHYQQMKKGAAILQSFVRGERTRQNFEAMIKKWKAAVIIQKHVKRWLTSKSYTGLQKDIITLQAVVRGERERHNFRVMTKRWSAAVIIQKYVKQWFASNAYTGLRKDVITLQAVVRGERARHNFEVMIKRWSAAIIIQKNVKQWLTSNVYTGLRKDIIILQAVIRGWLARKHFAVLKKQEESKFGHTLLEKREVSKMNLIIASKTLILGETLQHKLDVSKKDHFSESEDAGSVGAQTPGKLSAIPRKKFDRGARIVDHGSLADMESWQSDSTTKSQEEHQNPKPYLGSWKMELKMKIRKTKAALSKLIKPDKKVFKRWSCIASPT